MATTKKPAAKKAVSKVAKKAVTRKAPARVAKKATPKKTSAPAAASDDAARKIDYRIQELGDWRGEKLAQVRKLIHDAVPQVIEEVKWRGVPVWSHDGILCTGESYKQYLKLTFAKGASVPDPSKLFNASLEGNMRRAIDIREDDRINATAFKALIKAAAKLNSASKAKKKT